METGNCARRAGLAGMEYESNKGQTLSVRECLLLTVLCEQAELSEIMTAEIRMHVEAK